MKYTPTGKRNHYLEYQTRTTTLDALRQPVESWTTRDSWFAEIRPATGREAIDAQQTQAIAEVVITTRHPGAGSEFSTAGRFVESVGESSWYFNITRVFDPTGKGHELVCYATRADSPTES